MYSSTEFQRRISHNVGRDPFDNARLYAEAMRTLRQFAELDSFDLDTVGDIYSLNKLLGDGAVAVSFWNILRALQLPAIHQPAGETGLKHLQLGAETEDHIHSVVFNGGVNTADQGVSAYLHVELPVVNDISMCQGLDISSPRAFDFRSRELFLPTQDAVWLGQSAVVRLADDPQTFRGYASSVLEMARLTTQELPSSATPRALSTFTGSLAASAMQ